MENMRSAAESARLYDEAEPKQFGNTYERMKFLTKAIECTVRGASRYAFDELHQDLERKLRVIQRLQRRD